MNGLGFSIFYDSNAVSVANIVEYFTDTLIAKQVNINDVDDLDNDESTDKVLRFAWIDVGGNWPGQVPVYILNVDFKVNDTFVGTTAINVTTLSPFYIFAGESLLLESIRVANTSENHCTFDVDRNGDFDMLSDGVMIMRFLGGFQSDQIVEGAYEGEEVDGVISSLQECMQ